MRQDNPHAQAFNPSKLTSVRTQTAQTPGVKISTVLRGMILLGLPLTALALSIVNDYMYFKEVASASVLISLLSMIHLFSHKPS